MIVTVDGPAGAGKSTLARALAQRLGFSFLDTGAMYRAVTLRAIRLGGPWHDPDRLAALAEQGDLELDGHRVLLDGEDVSENIRSVEVTSHVHYMADNPVVRRILVDAQRVAAQGKDIVSEGRDQGTVAFPAADCKIYLTATPQERARRRTLDLRQRGEHVAVEDVLAQQNERDRRDATRDVGRLEKAADAIEVITDGMTQDQVLEQLVDIVRRHMPSLGNG